MKRSWILTAVLAPTLAGALLAAGCASETTTRPYSLTGYHELTADQQRWVDQNSIDQKGHYNPTMHQEAMARMRLANSEAQ